MVRLEDFGEYETAWCPGCGNFSILEAVKSALVEAGLPPHQVLFVSGIGQAAKAPHYLNANVFNGLHGRALPVATGTRMAGSGVTVIAESGDGCMYGEGGNHFIAALRRNVDITVLVHNNQVYGLTKGQASPTSEQGFTTKAQPRGVATPPFNPAAAAISGKAGLVARSFSGFKEHLTDMIVQALKHNGLSLVDIMQPCVSFNKRNTFAWYKKRCTELEPEYDPASWESAMKRAFQLDETIPIGVLYKNNRPAFGTTAPAAGKEKEPAESRRRKLEEIFASYR